MGKTGIQKTFKGQFYLKITSIEVTSDMKIENRYQQNIVIPLKNFVFPLTNTVFKLMVQHGHTSIGIKHCWEKRSSMYKQTGTALYIIGWQPSQKEEKYENTHKRI